MAWRKHLEIGDALHFIAEKQCNKRSSTSFGADQTRSSPCWVVNSGFKGNEEMLRRGLAVAFAPGADLSLNIKQTADDLIVHDHEAAQTETNRPSFRRPSRSN